MLGCFYQRCPYIEVLQNWVWIQLIVMPHILGKVQCQIKEVCRLIEPCLLIGTREYVKKIMPKWSYLLLQGWLFMRRISLDRRLWGVPSASYPRLFPFAKILLPRRVPTGDGCKVLPIYQERIFRLPRGLRHRSAHNPFLVLCSFLQSEVESIYNRRLVARH